MNNQIYNFNNDVIKTLLTSPSMPFAMLYRPDANGKNGIDILTGDISIVEKIEDIKLDETGQQQGESVHEKLVLIPYRQIAENGFEATDDNTPLVVMNIEQQTFKKLDDVIREIPSCDIKLEEGEFDIDDSTYESIVESILKNEIGQGKGASFVIKRSYIADISNYSTAVALSIFKKLLIHETGSYWTFVIHTGERTLIGATPERHVTLENGFASMNPISGTYRYPTTGPNLPEVTEFLRNKKEIDELYIVVDEELKMMSKACDNGLWIDGPKLKEMASLAHTEYFIYGKTSKGPLQILKETMFAPTVMGGPLESAARVIHEYEPDGRGYYSGVIALIGKKDNKRVIDSSIVIRTADISNNGRLKISVGATLVRDSIPADETAETRAKASGVLSALGVNSRSKLGNHPDVVELLNNRNKSIADFWLNNVSFKFTTSESLIGKRILIIDAEDNFTSMIKLQLLSLGCSVTVCSYDEKYSFDDNYDLVVMGPGPGDPNDISHPKISHLHNAIKELFYRDQPFLSICLSHQVLSSLMGLKLVRRDSPNQGVQKEINFFDKNERVGFYNTFSAYSSVNIIVNPITNEMVEVSRDPSNNEVNAIRGRNFCGIQFHAESLLTIDGVRIFKEIITQICNVDEADAEPAPDINNQFANGNINHSVITPVSIARPVNHSFITNIQSDMDSSDIFIKN